MLSIKFIREHPQVIKEALQKRGVRVDVDKLLAADKARRQHLLKVEEVRALKNKASKLIAAAKNQGERTRLIAKMRKIDKDNDVLEKDLAQREQDFMELMYQLPNIPAEDVPVGKDDSENKVLREEGKKPTFTFQPKDYLTLTEPLDLIDVKRAAKVSGSRFGYLKGEVALLEFALVQFALDTLVKEGFTPVVPPVFIRPEMMRGMGYIDTPDDIAERYFFEKDNLFLVGTSEQAIGPMHAGEVLVEEELPKRYVAFSTCFREEAGSYGKDTKGILRVHQFDKVEMFSFTTPETSQQEHEYLVSLQEKLVQQLKLPYRVVQLCTGDMARPSATTIDLETWMPGQKTYRETHSASNCTDFQARRLNIRYRSEKGAVRFVHTLNATAFAMSRMPIALIENNQKKDGSIAIPRALKKYVGLASIKPPKQPKTQKPTKTK